MQDDMNKENNEFIKMKIMQDSIINFAANLGTDKDKRSYSRWGGGRGDYNGYSNRLGFNGSLSQNRIQLEQMYSDDWLCGKVIDIPIEDMLREWRTVDFKGNDEMKTQFEEAEEKFGVREAIEDALKWADLYGGAGIILGVDGCGDAVLPLDERYVAKGSLKFIRSIDRWYLSPLDINYYDVSQPNYFKPNFYRIAGTAKLIHHSRLIRFDGIKMPRAVAQLNWLWGLSKLQRLQDALLNAATTPNVLASLMLECNFPVISVEGLAATLSAQGGEEKLQRRFAFANLMKSMFNSTILDAKETYDLKSPMLVGLETFIDKFFQVVAGGSDIPVTRLMQEALSGMNSTGNGELINYYDGLKSKQSSRIRPPLNKLDKIILMNTFGYIPKEFSWKFNPLWQLSDKEQAEVQESEARTAAIYVSNNILPPTVITGTLQKKGTYENITDDLVNNLENEFISNNLKPEINKKTFDLEVDPMKQEQNDGFTNRESFVG